MMTMEVGRIWVMLLIHANISIGISFPLFFFIHFFFFWFILDGVAQDIPFWDEPEDR